ncbi:DNA replication and repair protein RecF [Candidatus Gottesmanbacteria bacterium]|nr:DNA replication and repair protein RecF [Candidatus Gottesmanbacteria bacterium]
MISSLRLINFRNYSEFKITFPKNLICIVGDNASGKTNLIEALFLLSHAKSFRAISDRDMIYDDKEIGRVSGKIIQLSNFQLSNEKVDLEVVLTTGSVMGQRVALKTFSINGVGKRMVDFVGIFKTVLFWPEDLELVTGSPVKRRRYIDFVLSGVDREYRRTLISYEKGLRSRNKLLEAIREGRAHRHQLIFWDQLLIKDGEYITSKRQEYIEYLNNIDTNGYKAEYDKSIISRSRLDQYKDAEVAAGVTLVGPHRDDILIKIKDKREKIKDNEWKDLVRFGSRGEQRLSILWLKLAELSYIEQITGEKPTLLLDDIFSELDHEHREIVMKACHSQQTIMTTTDKHFIENFPKGSMKVVQL